MQLYQVDNNTVFLMSSDPSTASIGLMEKGAVLETIVAYARCACET